MNDVILRIIASVVTACLFCIATLKSLGAMQQSGYKNGTFLRWLYRKDNLFYNRLSVFALCLALASTVTALCFSFLGVRQGLLLSAIPFYGLSFLYFFVDRKYALKVKTEYTGRLKRLFVVYVLAVASVAFGLISLLAYLAEVNGSQVYGLIAYAPFSALPMLLPFILCLANGINGVFENARNQKYVKRAGQVLRESDILTVGIVGSYGKTSVKNILKTLLSEKYAVVATPSSYNTPMGIAKTVFSPEFKDKQVFIAEMGARKIGDIQQLCKMVAPKYAIFTGVCEQHVQTFETLENIWTEKSEILRCGAKVALGKSAQELAAEYRDTDDAIFVDFSSAQVQLKAESTAFTFTLGGEEVKADVPLLGEFTVENVILAATIAYAMGLTAQEIENGIKKIQPIPHRLQLIKSGGVFVLDDAYNCNVRGAEAALEALQRFSGRKCIVTPGIVEGGVLEESLNQRLGKTIAAAELDKVILVGDTLVGCVKSGYIDAGGDNDKLCVLPSLQSAQEEASKWLQLGDAILFLNDLPDVY